MAVKLEGTNDVLVRTREAARYLGVTISYVRRLAREGSLPGRRVPGGWEFLRSTLRAWKRRGGSLPEGAAAPPPQRPGVLDTPGAAALLGVAKSYVRRKAQCGEIPAARNGRGWEFEREKLEEWDRTERKGRGRPLEGDAPVRPRPKKGDPRRRKS